MISSGAIANLSASADYSKKYLHVKFHNTLIREGESREIEIGTLRKKNFLFQILAES